METIPTEIVDIITGIAIAADYDIITAIELTCRQFHKVAKRLRRVSTRDPIGYYLRHESVAGVAFAYSLHWPFGLSYRANALLKNTPSVVEEVFKITGINKTTNGLESYVAECVYKGFAGHMMVALKYGYQPNSTILTVAANFNKPEMLLMLLDRMPAMDDRYRAIETTIMYLFRNLSLFKMIDLGLRLKQIPNVDPRYISVVIYSIYRHSSMREEPEFIIRWILDNLTYQPMGIPIRDSYTRVNSMLKQHRFKLLRIASNNADIERLLNACV